MDWVELYLEERIIRAVINGLILFVAGFTFGFVAIMAALLGADWAIKLLALGWGALIIASGRFARVASELSDHLETWPF